MTCNSNQCPQLYLPAFNIKTRVINNQFQIFDKFRKIWVILTPEEWVRQHLINYLTEYLNYPIGLLAIEFSFLYGKRKKRADAVFFSKNNKPLVLIECKAPQYKINYKTFLQISAYASALNAPYLLISNGFEHFFFEITDCKLVQHQAIFHYNQLSR